MFIYPRIREAQKIIIGAGGSAYAGWVSTDREDLDITKKEHFTRFWRENTLTAFLAEHVWEHLNDQDAARAASHCFACLKPGGHLRIAVPDGYHPDRDYIENVRPGGTGPEDHKVLYTYQTLGRLLLDAGFRIELLENWDEENIFHRVPWSSEDGHIIRSCRYDYRNLNGRLVYTSLIIDAIKPQGFEPA